MKSRYQRLGDMKVPKGHIGKIIFVLGTIAAFLVFVPPWETKKERGRKMTEKVMKLIEESEDRTPLMYEREIKICEKTLRVKVISGEGMRLNLFTKEFLKKARALAENLDPANKSGEVYKINANAGEAPVKVSDELFELLKFSVAFSKESGGFFDITLKPYYDLWKFGGIQPVVPSKSALKALRPLVGANLIELDEEKKTVFLPKEGMGLDLRVIRNGAVLSFAAKRFREEGFNDHFIFYGADAISGGKRFEYPWRLSLQHPRKAIEQYGAMELSDSSGMTANYYEQSFISKGKRYHPFLDPRTGMPGKYCLTAAIIGKDPLLGEALVHAAFLMGPKKGLKFIAKKEGYEATFMDPYEKVSITDGLRGRVELKEKKDKPEKKIKEKAKKDNNGKSAPK